jgi:hypothetical protein
MDWSGSAIKIVSLCLVVLVAACSVGPWVKPYEREHLADPIMNPSRDPLSAKHRQHVYATREGSRGAESGEGGGCGCN